MSLDPRDHAEITDLYACYNHASDAGDAEAYAACFTSDGILRVRGLEVRDGALRRDPAAEFAIRGRAELMRSIPTRQTPRRGLETAALFRLATVPYWASSPRSIKHQKKSLDSVLTP